MDVSPARAFASSLLLFAVAPVVAKGKAVRERVKVTNALEQAYGPSDPKKVQEVPLDKIPEDARKVGTLLSAQGFDGPIRVAEVRADVRRSRAVHQLRNF